MIRAFATALLLTAAPAALAQVPQGNTAPQPLPFVDTVPAARDIPFPGTIRLHVDASDVSQGIFRVQETIPVPHSGHMVLMYPKWILGKHGPRGEIEKLAGLVIKANGRVIPWTRDPVDVFSFHIDVPAGAKKLDVAFQFVSATRPDQGRVVMTPAMLNLQWFSLSLYPAGYYVRRIPVQASATYPAGWTAASAIPAKVSGATYTYQTSNYEVLIDSPVFAGRYYRQWPLSPRVDLNVVADTPDELNAREDQIARHRALVEQAVKLFGAQHYDKYEFLLSISDEIGGIGVEHHRSSENGTRPGYFTKWDEAGTSRNLLPHEFSHSWIGKYRRGADQWTPDYRTPMRDTMLWAYEGLDQFTGYVLGARSGMNSKEETLEMLAGIAAGLDNRAARRWRPLIDTTHDPVITPRAPKGWPSWQRSEDYYTEGALIWMEVDSILREKSGGTKSIDDYLRAFYGMRDGDYGDNVFTMADIVRTLNGIVPYDWQGLLDTRLNDTSEHAPMKGLERNGYRLIYTDQPNRMSSKSGLDLNYSLGLAMGRNGIAGVMWDSPAFAAGMSLADEIVSVNGEAFSNDRLRDAVKQAKGGKEPIRLFLKRGDHYREVAIDYHGGLRYPHLERTGPGEAGLDKLLQPR